MQPSSEYSVRVRGVNACGPGPWSEYNAEFGSFMIRPPGYPDLPCLTKIEPGGDVEGASEHLAVEALLGDELPHALAEEVGADEGRHVNVDNVTVTQLALVRDAVAYDLRRQ